MPRNVPTSDTDHALELRLGRLRQRFEEQDAGVVDENVHAAELTHRVCGHCLPARLIGDVVMTKQCGATDRARQRLALAVEHVGYDDLCTLRGEQAGRRLAHAARSARDDRHLAGQSSHLKSPPG
jgi:hypothetical protein